MRKLQKTHFNPWSGNLLFISRRQATGSWAILTIVLLLVAVPFTLSAQCQLSPGSIKGHIFIDANLNGVRDISDPGKDQTIIRAYDQQGNLAATAVSNATGAYQLNGLVNNTPYRLEIDIPAEYFSGFLGPDNLGDVRFATAPACNIHFGIGKPVDFCGPANTKVAVTCFTRGYRNQNADRKSILSIAHNFNASTKASSLATQQTTGSVWGLAWNRSLKKLYSSAFIKYGTELGPHGTGAIYVTNPDNQQTSLYIDLQTAGINTGSTTSGNITHCDYSIAVGKAGLGDMDITSDDRFLLVTNLFKKSLVIVPTIGANASNIMEIVIPDPGCSFGDYVVSAVKYHNGHVYLGVTCTAETSANERDFYFHIYEFNLLSRTFNIILSTDFGRSHWLANPVRHRPVSQWLTNLDFSDHGHMILAITDRTSHTYCEPIYPLSNQFGDILLAYKDGGVWRLEHKGVAGNLVGSGVNNNEGPGRGEFFGEDYWVIGPGLHPEVSFGSIGVLPGAGEVVSTVFDPLYNSFTGGLHRYSTTNGKKTGAVELYFDNEITFGKASGLGDVEILCEAVPIQIGNYVWIDQDKDGIQDAGENGIANVRVSLYDENCRRIASVLTNDDGLYFFNNSNVDKDGDGVADGLAFNTQYYIVIDDSRFDKFLQALITGAGAYSLTQTNSHSGVGSDVRDNDAAIMAHAPCRELANLPVVAVRTGNSGENIFTFDFGFITGITDPNPPPPPPPPPPAVVYDLALIKTLVSSYPIQYNNPIEFWITVENQGNTVAGAFEIIDYIPEGLTLSFSQTLPWVLHGNTAKLVFNQPLAPGSRVQIPIRFELNRPFSGEPIINAAEISLIRDLNGDAVGDQDSRSDEIPDNDIGGVVGTPTDNFLHGDGVTDEDDHDREAVQVYDLALILTTNVNTPVVKNEDVLFHITVCNQGNAPVQDIELAEYVPDGLAISPFDINGWVAQNGIFYGRINAVLNPKECLTKEILLRVKPNARPNQLLNRAEIVRFNNLFGQDISHYDLDSHADNNPDNDAGGQVGTITDNVFNGDGIFDEDDADPAQLFIMDLALLKRLSTNTSLLYKGQIEFTLEVYNQGNYTVDEFQLIDYLPADFTLAASPVNQGWISNSGAATLTIAQALAPGEMRSFHILLRAPAVVDVGNLINRAEIAFIGSGGQNLSLRDFDSKADDDPHNDTGGVPQTATDNMITDDGGFDEDDADPANIPVYDLAIRKTTLNPNVELNLGDEVRFEFEIFNQGNMAVRDVELVDYMHRFMRFDQQRNSKWTQASQDILKTKISETILPGASVKVSLSLEINTEIERTEQLPNCVEIASFRNIHGDVPLDYDSKPDEDRSNDKGLSANSPTRNLITDHGELDEDDSDCSATQPLLFDLALYKSVDHYITESGNELEFTIIVLNQGIIPATSIGIVDYLPNYLTLLDQEWQPKEKDGTTRYYIVLNERNGKLPVGGLQPKDSITLKLKVKVNDDAPNIVIVNRAEIFKAESEYNIPDIDSTPDDDETNDSGGKVFTDSDGNAAAPEELPNDEDDADPAGIIVLGIERATPCFCLNNASTPHDGQFSEELNFLSRSGEVWFIRQVNGLYDPNFPSPAAPVPFVTGPTGFILTELPNADGTSIYTMTGIHFDAVGFSLILENHFGDKINIGNVRCYYDPPVVLQAQNNACTGQTTRFAVNAVPNGSYSWTLSSGGSIVGASNNAYVDVMWTGAPNTTHTLTIDAYSPDLCLEPIEFPVTLGTTSGQVSCLGQIQISLDQNCQTQVTPQMLLIGGPYDYNSYAVMIMNKDGSLVPNATLTHTHLGKTLKTKVVNVCNGNSCWANITVEDKLRPRIECLNDTIDCIRMKSYLQPFTYDNCDGAPKTILLDETVEYTDCNPLYARIVHRKYIAVDNWGNVSDTCRQSVYLRRIELDSLIWPDSLTIRTNNPLICSGFATDSLGFPLPSVTGVPMYKGQPAWPNDDFKYCAFRSMYTDREFKSSSCVRKILRTWDVMIWYCHTFDRRVYNQLIEVIDTIPPVIVCPHNITATTDGKTCEATVFVPAPKVVDSCTAVVRVDLVYPGGFAKNFKGGYLNLQGGSHTLLFRAYDACHNVDSCTFQVLVEDRTPPVAVCDRQTVITLDRFGMAWVPASVFDDGSYDDCQIKSMKARRMDNGQSCQLKNFSFSDSIGFCCNDLNGLVTVLFQVTDKAGNTNTCMVEVEVQDKILPHIYCPRDVTINCEEHIDTADLSRFGSPQVSDNCHTAFFEIKQLNIDQCREGYIDRVFLAGNSNGFRTCVQRIHIINDKPFTSNHIFWPRDFDTSSCDIASLDPSVLRDTLGFPIVHEDLCDLVGISYEDHAFRIINGLEACYKILRKWKVINWCRYNRGLTDSVYTYLQIIKVHNTVAPTFITGCRDTVFAVIDTSCAGGQAYLVAEADDDCTPLSELRWQYHIDLDSDNIFDFSNFGFGNRIDASGFYRLGKHRIKYVFEDQCGNKSVCDRNFEIINCKPPTAYCISGLSISLVLTDKNGDGRIDAEEAVVWAKDFDRGSFHPCGYDITLSFGLDTNNKSITYNCDSVGRRLVTLCATASNGKADCCSTFIEVQDNNDLNLCNCVKFPNDTLLTNCDVDADPAVIRSMPQTFDCNNCRVDDVKFTDAIVVGSKANVCYTIERSWIVRFNCEPNPPLEFDHVQRIDVTTNLRLSDITWPADSVIVDNCDGSFDTLTVRNTPRYCEYDGQVMMRFTDREIRRDPDCRFIERMWTVFSKCVASQSFNFRQVLKIRNPDGIRYIVPADITVDNCRGPFTPDLLNGFPRTNCPCPQAVHTFRDSIVNSIPNSCFIIHRMWRSTFNCPPDISGTFTGTQRITIKVNLQERDIRWPADSLVVNNCGGKTDTASIGGVPRLLRDFCGYVSIRFRDSIVSNVDTCRIVHRNWVVSNDCSVAPNKQEFRFRQVLKVLFPNGPRVVFPRDTVIRDCRTDLRPNSLGVFPRVLCPCDSVTHTTRDDTLRNNPEVCFVIRRTWSTQIRCRPDVDTVVRGVQLVTLDVDLNAADIIWPRDSFESVRCIPNLDPNITGRPALRREFCGFVTFTFADTLDPRGRCRTIRRTWTARNACSSSQVFRFTQFLVTKNQQPPNITCQADTSVLADPGFCGAVVRLRNPRLNDDCNTAVTFSRDKANDTFNVGVTVVTFTARDTCGNVSTCTTRVTVTENIPPDISCPGDTTIPCGITTEPLSQFGDPVATDNCPGVRIVETVTRRQDICGIGTITRKFVAIDASGNRDSCTQLITVENTDPIDSADIDWPDSPVMVDECQDISPDSLGRPEPIPGSFSCALLRITYQDTNLCASRGRCEIERNWQVFDSCSNRTFNFTQLIIRNDSVPPTITGVRDTTVFASDTACNNFITLIARTTDCDSATVKFTNDSPVGNGREDASGFYPLGTTRVTFTAMDACCNMSMLTVTITVIDTVKPEFTCRKVAKEIGDDGCAYYNAREFVLDLSDNCSDTSMIDVAFDRDFTRDTFSLCCDTLVNRDFLAPLKIYFRDEAGNVDSCCTLVQAYDTVRRICPDNTFGFAAIKGLVQSRKGISMNQIDVMLNNGAAGTVLTDNFGFYNFGRMPKGNSYRLNPQHDVDPLNGVTTLDILLIQRHLLALNPFDHPYKWIAADVNKNNRVTVADIAEIRRLLLGASSRFSNNQSWRFIKANYRFEDPSDPLFENFPEVHNIPSLNRNEYVDFVGIKVGDIDDSNKPNGARGGVQIRSSDQVAIVTENLPFTAGEVRCIEFFIDGIDALAGAQFALHANPAFVELLEVDMMASEGITADELHLQQNTIRVSWINNHQSKQLRIAVKVKVLRDAYASQIFSMDSGLLRGEAYSLNLEILPLELQFNQIVDENMGLVLYQNIPNPFTLSTRIPFRIDRVTEVKCSILDMHGKLIYSESGHFDSGYHEFKISRSKLPYSGIYYYQIQTGTTIMVRTMMAIDRI